jgi:hypothetical protein
MIDENDWILKAEKHQNTRFYRCHCDRCGKDRGYLEKRKANKPCHQCSKQTPKSLELRNSEFCNLDDYIEVKGGHKKYRSKCPKCTTDLGYRAGNCLERWCRECYKTEYKMTQETKDKIGKASLARPRTEECKRKISLSNTGKTLTKEQKQHLSKINKGKPSNRKGSKHTEEAKIKTSMNVRGVTEFSGFVTNNTRKESSYDMRVARGACFQRENFTCQKCKVRGGILNAHHANSWKFYPNERYVSDNLICLCNNCHKEFHKTYGTGCKDPNTLSQIIDFLKQESI